MEEKERKVELVPGDPDIPDPAYPGEGVLDVEPEEEAGQRGEGGSEAESISGTKKTATTFIIAFADY